MSQPLSSSTKLSMRKDLIRLRMEMNRQQILYHSQPLTHPFQRIKGAMGMVGHRGPRSGSDESTGKGPLMIAMTLALAVFGRRLGKVGKLAKLGITLYPLILRLRR